MLSYDEFNKEVMLGYMCYENTIAISMYYKNFTKFINVKINAFLQPGQILNMTFEKLKSQIQKHIQEWYIELEPELKKDDNIQNINDINLTINNI